MLDEFMLDAWGWNYFYVREFKPGFKVKWISEELVKEKLTNNLHITRLDYPSEDSKQISIFFGNSEARYKFELRNKKGGLKPTEATIKILTSNFAK